MAAREPLDPAMTKPDAPTAQRQKPVNPPLGEINTGDILIQHPSV